MTIQIALGLLAAAIPLTAVILKFSGTAVSAVEFAKLETEFRLFRDEVRRDFKDIKTHFERDYNDRNTD